MYYTDLLYGADKWLIRKIIVSYLTEHGLPANSQSRINSFSEYPISAFSVSVISDKISDTLQIQVQNLQNLQEFANYSVIVTLNVIW